MSLEYLGYSSICPIFSVTYFDMLADFEATIQFELNNEELKIYIFCRSMTSTYF